MKKFENMNAGTAYLIVVVFWLTVIYLAPFIIKAL